MQNIKTAILQQTQTIILTYTKKTNVNKLAENDRKE